MSELDELREIRTILVELRDMERAHLALYRQQAERVEQSIQTQELAVARQRTAMRMGYLLIAVVLLLLAPLVVWILWKL